MSTALVTGASSGMGLEFARQLSGEGYDLVLVARSCERLEKIGEALRDRHGVSTEVLVADLGKAEDTAKVAARLRQTPAVEVLVNAAGFGISTPFLETSLEEENQALNVMVRAVMETCHAAGSTMRAAGRGRIINVSSVAADSGMGPYSAHKAWVRSFSQGLAAELQGSGVSVTATMPGLVRTEFHERAGADYTGAPALAWTSASEVVTQTLAASRKGRVVFTPTLRYKVVSGVQRAVPRTIQRAAMRLLPHM